MSLHLEQEQEEARDGDELPVGLPALPHGLWHQPPHDGWHARYGPSQPKVSIFLFVSFMFLL